MKGLVLNTQKTFLGNLTPNYFRVTKIHMKRLNLNAVGDFGIFHFKREEEKKSLMYRKFRFF